VAAFLKALLFVVVGEMGDKTQLLAIAMAGKYKAGQVLLGVFVATVLNHALAVIAGSFLGNLIPLNIISIVAGISFLAFALWTLRGDSDDDRGRKGGRWGPVVTVGIAFFLAEMGDKTQLMTITIAAEFRQPLAVLLGTTTGMMVADGIGILFGAWICSHIPDRYIKWGAGLVFLFFGSLTLYESIDPKWITPLTVILYLSIIAGLTYWVGFRLRRKKQTPCDVIDEETASKEALNPARPG
jgi:Ca2+/H+ antiporter, TMEM165/GDT1 family